MPRRNVKITHRPSDEVLAEGPLGWGITAFDGAYYVARKHLKTHGFKSNFLPGLCPYKFLYVGLDYRAPGGAVSRGLAWFYWLPNPLLPFIAWRVALPQHHPELDVEVLGSATP